MRNNHQIQTGFTLIELLIVVLIIAILAAIAVPNFLEAQTRSKVSRAMADMRSIATALEAYAVDWDAYPPNPALNEHFYVTPAQITTPVAYMTVRPEDPFKFNRDVALPISSQYSDEDQYYDYFTIITTAEYTDYVNATGNDVFVVAVDASGSLASLVNQGAKRKYGAWLQWSIGPDVLFWNADEDFINPQNSAQGLNAPAHLPWGYSFDVPYDPTNGTNSFGNLIRSQANSNGTKPLSDF